MAKRTAINTIARSFFITLVILVGVLFAGHYAQAQTVENNPTNFSQGEISLTVEIDNFLLSPESSVDPVLLAEESAQIEEDSLVVSVVLPEDVELASTTEEIDSLNIGELDNTTSTQTQATSTIIDLDISTTTSTSTNSTSTENTLDFDFGTTTATTSATTTIEIDTDLSTTTEATTTINLTGGAEENASTTILSLTANLEADLASTTASTTSQVWRSVYFLYSGPRTDMAGWGIPFSEIEGIDFGDPLTTGWTRDWFDSSLITSISTENGLHFRDEFTPFTNNPDDVLDDSEEYLVAPNFGARFMGIGTVETEGDYTYTVTSDGDVWFYVAGGLDSRIQSGIKPAETKTGTVHMVPGEQYILQLFFTERIALYPYFDFSFPGVTIIPCPDDVCTLPELDDDTTGPSAPIIISSTHGVNATTSSTTVGIVWTDSVDPQISGRITSGLAGYSFLWDHTSDTTPDTTIDGTPTTTTSNLSPGIWWFHLVAIDNAGNVSSPVTHYGPVVICGGDIPCGGEDDEFFIRNIRVNDITTTSVVIHWRTENPDATGHPATSRVIYDTVSHLDISGAAAPNYGYAFSSATSDVDPKVVEHTVAISGLTPNTVYYFRVISEGSPIVISNEFGGNTNNNGGGGNQTDTTGPSAPIIISSTHGVNATTSSTTVGIVWTDSVDPQISGRITSGLAGYSFLWDHTSDTTPDTTIDGTPTTTTSNLSPGIWWFHLVAIDNAGNVSSPVTHYGPVVICGGDIPCSSGGGEGTFTTLPTGGGGGGGGSSGGGGGSSGSKITTTVPPVTPTLPVSCKPYLLKFIKLGANNDSIEVLKLQTFLKVFEGRNDIPLTGFYDLTTYNAVRDFQKKYGLDVLNPWGISDSTGYVFITTTLKINYIYCGIPDRITLNLRNIYPDYGTQFALAATPETEVVVTTSTSSTTLVAVSTSTATSTLNSVQLAFVGITDLLTECPWIWLLILLLLFFWAFWFNRCRDKKDKIVN